jgi:hypothetical protein
MFPLIDIIGFKMMSSELLSRYALNLIFACLLTRGIYYRNYRRSDLFLTFFGFNTIIFFVSYLLNQVELSTGAAFGLFAVFSILRYRTEGISAKDMTYLFLNIAIGLLTAVSIGSMLDIFFICIIISFVVFILESGLVIKQETSKVIYYDNIKLVHESQKELLLDDLKNRTGLDVQRFIVNDIDFLKDCCKITVYYSER